MENRSLVRQSMVEEGAGVLVEVSAGPRMTGGYADIYHGFWTNPQGARVEVAVKELRALIPRNQQTKEDELLKKAEMRISREAFVWSRITHPNLHPLLDYHSRPRPRLISPWCRHGNLLDYLQANPSLSRLDKLQLIYQAAYGLEHLHSRTPPISHADVKPENVLINDLGEAALSDFGLSRVLHGLDIPSGFTTSETVKGTLNYKAPELFFGEQPTCSSDVYAFGGLVLTVFSGRPPFDKLQEPNILFQIINNKPPKPIDHPKLPHSDPLWSLMRRCWDKSPPARPTMREVLWELWKCICQEKSQTQSRPSLPSNAVAVNSEDSAMDVETWDATLQEGVSTSTTADPVPAQGSPSGIIGAEGPGTRDSVARGVFPPALKIFKRLEVNSKAIPVFGRYIRAAVEVGFMLTEIVKTVDRNQDMANALESNTWKLAVFLERLEERLSGQRGDDPAACIADIKQELQSAQRHFKEIYSSGLFPKALSCCDHEEGLKQWEEMVLKTWEAMQLLVNLNTAALIAESRTSHAQEDQRRLLACLGDGKYGAQGNAIEDVVCLPGTRVQLLERIESWIRDTSTPDRVLWIRGMAGRGKSTIASTVAHNWQYRGSCAIFHYRRGQNALNERVVCALARQLGSSLVPEVKNAVLQSVRENEDIADQRLSAQFETLLVAPISTLKRQSHVILIVVDALDECENLKDAEDFVKLIDRHSSFLPTNVKFLLLCRPEAPLLRALEPRKWHVENLDSSPDVMNDLAQFFKQAFQRIRDDHGLSEDWPSHNDMGRLVEMSQGLFQWARTAITYIGSRSPASRLEDLLERPSMWNGLDDLYHQILSKAFDNLGLDSSRRELLRRILGILVVAPHPVSFEVLTTLCSDANYSIFKGVSQEDIMQSLHQDILVDLPSLLLIPTSSSEPIRLMHNSIRDLLINDQRCRERVYYIDVGQHHKRLAGLCLHQMVRCLKENIYNLSDLSRSNLEVQDMVDHEVPRVVRYCCQAWSIHLTEGAQWSVLGTHVTSILRIDFETFSRKKVLCWLEVMSMVGATNEAIVAAKRVHQWLLLSPSELSQSKSLNTLWSDTQRFIAAFSEPISFGSLHIYVSALPHCPQKTKLWEWYGEQAKIHTIRGVQPSIWSSNLWTRSAGACVWTVAFSPEGMILASGSEDGAIRLWNSQTGTPLGEPLTGHSHPVRSVAFSPNGRVLVSRCSEHTIRLWDARTRTPFGEPRTGHCDSVLFVECSPDGRILASVSSDSTIRLWDVQTGAPLGVPLIGHRHSVLSIAFSPDARILAARCSDHAVRLWDAQTGTPLHEALAGHRGLVTSVVFSPDGNVLASASFDRTVRLWNARTGMPLTEPLRSHRDWITYIAFSPGGRVLASVSSDSTIQLWDVQTGLPLGEPLIGHRHSVLSVTFSTDGRILASRCSDHTIRLWDGQTGSPLGEPLTGHRDWVTSVTFSPDGRALASVSSDHTIRLWDTQNLTPLGESLTDLRRSVTSDAFSPDGRIFASGSSHHVIRLWDAQKRAHSGVPPSDHGRSVTFIAFSPDGRVLASVSSDHRIRLWNVQTGAPLGGALRGHHDWVTSVVFSPDGKVLASGSEDTTIRLWDAHKRRRLGEPLIGHSDRVSSLAFSPNGRVLASGSSDHTIRLWDAQIGMPLGDPLAGHCDWVTSIGFSPDGKILASGSFDRTIRLWDAQTGTSWGGPLTGHSDWVSSVAFSPDGGVLASVSDHTIQLWNAQTGAPLAEPLKGCNTTISFVPCSHADPRVPETTPYRLLSFEDHWVTLSSSRVLWLPSQYWGDTEPTIHLYDQTLVIISDGTLSIFDVSGMPSF